MGWFSSAAPVDDEAKAWIEESFRWLIDELGMDVLQSVPVVLPTEEFFPDAFDGTRTSIRQMLNRVCEYMDVDPALIEVRFDENPDESVIHPFADDGQRRTHAVGTYQMGANGKFQVSLNVAHSSNPEMLVATIAHELGHIILLGEGRLDPEFQDHEPLTDLVTVYYGLGIFNANSSMVFEQFTNTQYQGWRMGGAGYLTEEAFGYALALFARLRNEERPAWLSYLSTNVRSYFKSSTKHINKAGSGLIDSLEPRARDTLA